MAKLYTIKLTEKGILINNKEGNAEIRKVEVGALASCVSIIAGKEKDIKKYNVAIDLHAQLIELMDNDKTEIRDISKDDIDIINEGFKAAIELSQMNPNTGEITKGRPGLWLFCRNLWRQLENPTEQMTEKAE